MNKLILTSMLVAFLNASFTDDFADCTQAMKDAADDVHEMVEDIEKDGWDVSSDAFKFVLEGASGIAQKCLKMDVDLTKYDDCVDAMEPVIPQVGHLVADISGGQFNNVIADVLQIVSVVQQGIASCSK